jgi:SAM-dependent methyltransferase
MKLNLCSGPNLWGGESWIHADRVDQSDYLRIMRDEYRSPEMRAGLPDFQRRLAEYLGDGGKIDFRVADARTTLPMFADESFEGIYLGQCAEHWNRQHETVNILSLCHRLLKPGGILRITTPDLDKLLDAYRLGRMHEFATEQPAYYAKADPADQLCYVLFGATGPSCTTEQYEGHFHCFTRGTMATALTEAGFSGPYQFFDTAGEGPLGDEVVDCGMSHSLCCVAVKS